MNAPSIDIKDYLETNTDLVFGTDLFIGILPEKPNRCIALFDQGGGTPEPTNITHPILQIIVRGNQGDYINTYTLMEYILNQIHSIGNIEINDTNYILVWKLTEIMSLGNDKNKRPLFSCTLRIQRSFDGELPTENLITLLENIAIFDSKPFLLDSSRAERPNKPLYAEYLNTVYPSYIPTGSTYYVRADGTAASLAEATSSSSAATSLSIATFHSLSGSISAGDTVIFSDAGGSFASTTVYLSAGGSDTDNRVTYKGASDSDLTFKRVYVFAGYMDIIDIAGSPVTDVDAFTIDSDHASVVADLVGIRTYNIKILNSPNQGVQHEGVARPVEVTHYNIYAEDCGDESLSCHNSPTVTVYGGVLRDGINWVNTPTIKVYDCYIARENGTAQPIQPPASVAYDVVFERCAIIDNPALTGHRMDYDGTGSVIFRDCEYFECPNEFVAVFRSTLTTAVWSGCTVVDYISTIRSKNIIFNDVSSGDYTNNIFWTFFLTAYQYAKGDRTGLVIKVPPYHFEIVSGSSLLDMIIKAPLAPQLIAADDGILFTISNTKKEINLATVTDTDKFGAGTKKVVVYSVAQSAEDRAKRDLAIGA